MRALLLAAAIAASSLVEAVALVSQPAAATPVPPVGLDPSRARHLVARITEGDGALRVPVCDPAGRGRAVVALGNPFSARNVAVLVPGSDIDLHTLDDPERPMHRPLGWARSLHA